MKTRKLLLLASFAVTGQWANAMLQDFSMQQYFDLCGGGMNKMYAQCDSSTVNQVTMLEHAKLTAKSKGKLVVSVFGFDSCPPCKTVHEALHNTPAGKAILESGHVFMAANIKTLSAKRLMTDHGLTFSTVPHFVVFDPNSMQRLDESDSSMPVDNSMAFFGHLISEAEEKYGGSNIMSINRN